MRTLPFAFSVGLAVALSLPAAAQTTDTSSGTGSAGCAQVVQAAADGAAARIQADDTALKAPQSVTQLSCLNNFFNGTGLNVISNLLNPTSLLTAVEGQICSAVNSAWQSVVGSTQCGLTVTGFDLGFSGFSGSGLLCPKLSFGGGGPPIGSLSTSYKTGNGTSLYVSGSPTMPAGYTAPEVGGLY